MIYSKIISKALLWFYRYRIEGGGIAISNCNLVSYPEVTGYWIPTLLKLNQEALAIDLADWLVSIQLADGSFYGADGKSNPFDTGQIIRGLHVVALREEKYLEPLKKACFWMISLLKNSSVPSSPYDEKIPPWVLIYAYQPVREAARFLKDNRMIARAEECIIAYSQAPHAPSEWDVHTHFYGYWLEGLVDAGYGELARSHLERLVEKQQKNGGVPAYPNVKWVCTPGLAQIAIAWYKLKIEEPARRAWVWLVEHQNPSGGWFGSYGKGASYFPESEISWAPKFVLDLADRLSVCSDKPSEMKRRLDSQEWTKALSSTFSAEVLAHRICSGERTAWTNQILRWTKTGQSILELGSGTGEIAANLAFHDRNVVLLDQSGQMLNSAKELFSLIDKKGCFLKGNLEKSLPFSDGTFDVIFSSGVLEHYEDEVIIQLLREFGRVSRKWLISLVPNAGSLPYRIGKSVLEAKGKWQWGYERPLFTLHTHHKAAGLKVVQEVTVGLKHSINFLRDAALDSLANQLEQNLPKDDCKNGYLLAVLAIKEV